MININYDSMPVKGLGKTYHRREAAMILKYDILIPMRGVDYNAIISFKSKPYSTGSGTDFEAAGRRWRYTSRNSIFYFWEVR